MDMNDPSQFFADSMGYDDSNAFPSPDQDVEDDNRCLDTFNPYSGSFGLGGDSQTPTDPRGFEPRANVWDSGYPGQLGTMGTEEQRPLFVDPGLYSPESEDEDVKPQIQVLPMDTSRPSTRRTSSTKSLSQGTSKSGSAGTDMTPPEHEPPPKKRKAGKKRKESSTAEDEQKRNKFLERNRIAASKCREKKKQYVSELEETKIGLEARHAELQAEYNDLVGQISHLKHLLMAHAKCNDANIDSWLNNEARKFVQTSTDMLVPPFGGFGQGVTPGFSTGSPRSRNHSIASSYPSLPGLQLDGLAADERRTSIAYSHGSSSLYPSPTEETFQPTLSPAFKREPGINYDHMPDSMFSPDQSNFGGG
ncbi:hypothetical protein VTI74DRAFT_9878 [Chaetomium olivicolor]